MSSEDRTTTPAPRGIAAGTRHQRPRANLLAAITAFLILGILLPLTEIPNIRYAEATTIAAVLLVVYSAARLSGMFAATTPRLVQTAFWTFTYSFLTLPFLAQLTTRTYPLATYFMFDDDTFAEAEWIIVVGLAGYEAGAAIARRKRRIISGQSAITDENLSNDAGVSTARAAVFGYLGLAVVAVTVGRYGLGPMFTSRDALAEVFSGPAPVGVKFYLAADKTTGLLKQFANQVPVFVGCYLLLYKRYALRNRVDIPRPSWCLIAPLIVGNVIINNPVSNPRFWSGTVAIAFITIFLPLRTKAWASRVFVFIFVAVSLFSFHQLAAFRRTGTTDLSNEPLSQSLVNDPDYGSPEQMLNGISWIDQNGYQFGRQLTGAVFVFIPRSLWSDKAGDTGQLIGGDAAGFKVSDPLWTEGQVDFGAFGAFGLLSVVGFAATSLDRRYGRFPQTGGIIAAITPIVASLMVFLLRGSLQPAFGYTIPVVVVFVACSTKVGGRGNDEVRLSARVMD